jgi:hypothetical protein
VARLQVHQSHLSQSSSLPLSATQGLSGHCFPIRWILSAIAYKSKGSMLFTSPAPLRLLLVAHSPNSVSSTSQSLTLSLYVNSLTSEPLGFEDCIEASLQSSSKWCQWSESHSVPLRCVQSSSAPPLGSERVIQTDRVASVRIGLCIRLLVIDSIVSERGDR